MLKVNHLNLIKIFLIPILFISLNLVFANSGFNEDKHNICTSENDKKEDYTCCQHCFLDNDIPTIEVKIFKITFLNIQEKYVIYLNTKINLIDPKSNSPPLIIFS